jgi:hypothetical protein
VRKEAKEDLTVQVVILLIYIVLIWAVWQVAMMPQWKREMILNTLRSRFEQLRGQGMLAGDSPPPTLTPIQEMEVQQFNQEISRWGHDL